MTEKDARQLLDRFYDGTSTPAENDALRHFFAEANNVPADLLPDAEIFLGNTLAPEDIPPMSDVFDSELLDSIDEAVENEKIQTRPATKRWTAWTMAAAAACVAAILFFRYDIAENRLSHAPIATPANENSYTADNETQSSDTITVVGHKGNDVVDVPQQIPRIANKIARNTSVSGNRHSQRTTSSSGISAEGYTIIDDPETASMAIEDSYRILASSISTAGKSLSQANNSMDRGTQSIASTIRTIAQP